MGKPVQQLDIDFIMRKYGAFTILQIHSNLANAVTRQNHWVKPQLNLSTLLREYTYGPAVQSKMILLLAPPSS